MHTSLWASRGEAEADPDDHGVSGVRRPAVAAEVVAIEQSSAALRIS